MFATQFQQLLAVVSNQGCLNHFIMHNAFNGGSQDFSMVKNALFIKIFD